MQTGRIGVEDNTHTPLSHRLLNPISPGYHLGSNPACEVGSTHIYPGYNWRHVSRGGRQIVKALLGR